MCVLGRSPHQISTEEGAGLTALDATWSKSPCLQVDTVSRTEPEAPSVSGSEGVPRDVECHWVAGGHEGHNAAQEGLCLRPTIATGKQHRGVSKGKLFRFVVGFQVHTLPGCPGNLAVNMVEP